MPQYFMAKDVAPNETGPIRISIGQVGAQDLSGRVCQDQFFGMVKSEYFCQ